MSRIVSCNVPRIALNIASYNPKNAILLNTVTAEQGKNKGTMAFMHHFYSIISYEGKNILLKLYVDEYYNRETDGSLKRAYELKTLKEIPLETDRSRAKGSTPYVPSGNGYTVADLFEIVKQADEEFNPKPCSLVLDSEGKPLVVWRRDNELFEVFDISRT